MDSSPELLDELKNAEVKGIHQNAAAFKEDSTSYHAERSDIKPIKDLYIKLAKRFGVSNEAETDIKDLESAQVKFETLIAAVSSTFNSKEFQKTNTKIDNLSNILENLQLSYDRSSKILSDLAHGLEKEQLEKVTQVATSINVISDRPVWEKAVSRIMKLVRCPGKLIDMENYMKQPALGENSGVIDKIISDKNLIQEFVKKIASTDGSLVSYASVLREFK